MDLEKYARHTLTSAALAAQLIIFSDAYSQGPKINPLVQLGKNTQSYIQELIDTKFLSPRDNVSIVGYDIERNKSLLRINPRQRVMAASTIKVYVMLAYFHDVDMGRIEPVPYDDVLLRAMIVKSDNDSTNALIRRIGGVGRIGDILSRYYTYFDETSVVESIPDEGRSYKNKTSADDLFNFYEKLWHKKLPHSDEMLNYLRRTNHDRLIKATCIPDTLDFHKSGSVFGMIGDGGIIVMRDKTGCEHPYILVGMIEDRSRPLSVPRIKGESKKRWENRRSEAYKNWKKRRENVIRRISEGVYDYLCGFYNDEEYWCDEHSGRHMRDRQ